MSTRAKHQAKKNRCLDGSLVDHRKYVQVYRHHTMRVIKDVRKGVVNEEDIDKLQNFVQFALALMDRASMVDIEKAWRNAEAMSFIHADLQIPVVDQDYGVVLDPIKQRQSIGSTDEDPSPGEATVERARQPARQP